MSQPSRRSSSWIAPSAGGIVPPPAVRRAGGGAVSGRTASRTHPSAGAAPQSEPYVYPARLVLGVVCDHCGAGPSLTIADPDPSGAGWAVPPDRCRNGCGADWRVMAVPGDGSADAEWWSAWLPMLYELL